MNHSSLPQELLDLESRLRAERSDVPAIELRKRLLAAVDRELAQPSAQPSRPNESVRWIAVAALVAVVLNLSFISASQSGLRVGGSTGAPQLATEMRVLAALEKQNGTTP